MRTYKEVMEKFYSHLTKDDLKHEEWKPVMLDGAESDRYLVSNLGRFADRTPPRIYHNYGAYCDIPGFGKVQMVSVSPVADSNKRNAADDYLQVHFNRERYQAHRVVASTFIRSPFGDETVDHIAEGNAFDNRSNNLQILSRRDNYLKGRIMRSYKSRLSIGMSWDKHTCKWVVKAPQDVFGAKRHVGYFDRFEQAAICAATIYRRYCRCDSDYIRKMLLKSCDDLANYVLTAEQQMDVDVKIAAFEERNADIIKNIDVQSDA